MAEKLQGGQVEDLQKLLLAALRQSEAALQPEPEQKPEFEQQERPDQCIEAAAETASFDVVDLHQHREAHLEDHDAPMAQDVTILKKRKQAVQSDQYSNAADSTSSEMGHVQEGLEHIDPTHQVSPSNQDIDTDTEATEEADIEIVFQDALDTFHAYTGSLSRDEDGFLIVAEDRAAMSHLSIWEQMMTFVFVELDIDDLPHYLFDAWTNLNEYQTPPRLQKLLASMQTFGLNMEAIAAELELYTKVEAWETLMAEEFVGDDSDEDDSNEN